MVPEEVEDKGTMVPEEVEDKGTMVPEEVEDKGTDTTMMTKSDAKKTSVKATVKKDGTAVKKEAHYKVKTEDVKGRATARRSARKQDLPPLPPPTEPPPTNTSSSSKGPKEEDDAMPSWVEDWGDEVNQNLDRDLATLLSERKETHSASGSKDKNVTPKTRTGWLNKCAALCQAYMDGEWDTCYQLVNK